MKKTRQSSNLEDVRGQRGVASDAYIKGPVTAKQVPPKTVEYHAGSPASSGAASVTGMVKLSPRHSAVEDFATQMRKKYGR